MQRFERADGGVVVCDDCGRAAILTGDEFGDVAKVLLDHIHEKLVIDWRLSAEAQADMRVAIRGPLDAGLPDEPYPRDVFDQKVQAIFDHVLDRYESQSKNVYTEPEPAVGSGGVATLDADTLIAQLRQNRTRPSSRPGSSGGADARRAARRRRDPRGRIQVDRPQEHPGGQAGQGYGGRGHQDVAAFLSTDGGTLLIGVRNDRTIHGLADDYAQVKPSNADGFVNWLDTMLETAIGKSAAARISVCILLVEAALGGGEVCRVDVPAASRPTWAKTSKQDRVFFRRRNNSTVAFAADEQEELDKYIADRWAQEPT